MRSASLLVVVSAFLVQGCSRGEPSFENQTARAAFTTVPLAPTFLPTPAEPSFQVVVPGTTLPVIRKRVEPHYPAAAVRACKQPCLVFLRLAITKAGDVLSAELLRSPSPELGEAALAAAKTWHFMPATRGGQPVPVYYSLQLNVPFPGGS